MLSTRGEDSGPQLLLRSSRLATSATLDPVLRLEERGINPVGIALVVAAFAYLFATPGVLVGAIDYYIFDKISRLSNSVPYGPDNFKLGKKLAQGGFGTVYRADLVADNTAEPEPVIVKMAKEFGEAEVWMNERLMRAAPRHFAKFITAFEEDQTEPATPMKAKPGLGPGQSRPDPDEAPLWLIWSYEGNYTLWDVMQNKNKSREQFPYSMEETLFGEPLQGPKDARRRQASVRLVLQQVLEALNACHVTGIVHRDVKPQNVIMSTKDHCAKLIDLGAAADLRVGINYVPSEFLMDPRYSPPQQYIMSTSTPRAPPLPVAAMLSPILWKLNSPDRFDMYSVGILLLQMAFPALRSDNNLIAFRKRLESQGFDLDVWRKWYERRHAREAAEGFDLLDLDDGAMWDLCKQLMRYKPSERISASASLQHATFKNSPLKAISKIGKALGNISENVGGSWLSDALGGAAREGGLTEAQLSDELGPGYRELPPALRNARATINWWQARQGAMKRAASGRRVQLRRSGTIPVQPAQEQSAASNGTPGDVLQPARAASSRLPALLPWQAAKPSSSDKGPSAAPAEEPVHQQPVARQQRKPLVPNLLPWLNRSNGASSQGEEVEEGPGTAASEVQPAEEPVQQQRRWRSSAFAGLPSWLSRPDPPAEGGEEEFEQEEQGARSSSSLPKKLLPWLKTTGTS